MRRTWIGLAALTLLILLAALAVSSDGVRLRYALWELDRSVETRDAARFSRWADSETLGASMASAVPLPLPQPTGPSTSMRGIRIGHDPIARQLTMRIDEMVAGTPGRGEWQSTLFDVVSGRDSRSHLLGIEWLDDASAVATVIHDTAEGGFPPVRLRLRKAGSRWRLVGVDNIGELSTPIAARIERGVLASNDDLRARIAAAVVVDPPRRLEGFPPRLVFVATNRSSQRIDLAVFRAYADFKEERIPVREGLAPGETREIVFDDRWVSRSDTLPSVEPVVVRFAGGESIELAEEPWR